MAVRAARDEFNALLGYRMISMQTPQTIVAREIYDLHTLIFVICCVIFVVVFGAMIYAIIKHRKSVGRKAEQFHENVKVEIAWAVIPFLILIGMVYPATKTVISMNDTSSPDMTIKVSDCLPGNPCLSKLEFLEGMNLIS